MMVQIKWWDGETSWLSYRTHELMQVIELLLQAIEDGTGIHGINVV